MGFANYYNKVRFIFNLFDFESTHDLSMDQLSLLVICFLEGWSKMIDKELPQRRYSLKLADIIYSTSNNVFEGRININGLGDWIDQNENLIAMFLMFEPPIKIKEASSLFLPLERNTTDFSSLCEIYLGKKTVKEAQLKGNFSTVMFRKPRPQ